MNLPDPMEIEADFLRKRLDILMHRKIFLRELLESLETEQDSIYDELDKIKKRND